MFNKTCGLCGVGVGKNNQTRRCRQCSKNAFCPTLEQIAEAGAEIRKGWASRKPQGEGDGPGVYCPKVYRLDRRVE